jgi:hypothetical protein
VAVVCIHTHLHPGLIHVFLYLLYLFLRLKLVPGYEAHPDVLVETFCEGIPVAKWAKKNAGNQEKLSSMCKIGIRTVCKMIFDHNFIHGK